MDNYWKSGPVRTPTGVWDDEEVGGFGRQSSIDESYYDCLDVGLTALANKDSENSNDSTVAGAGSSDATALRSALCKALRLVTALRADNEQLRAQLVEAEELIAARDVALDNFQIEIERLASRDQYPEQLAGLCAQLPPAASSGDPKDCLYHYRPTQDPSSQPRGPQRQQQQAHPSPPQQHHQRFPKSPAAALPRNCIPDGFQARAASCNGTGFSSLTSTAATATATSSLAPIASTDSGFLQSILPWPLPHWLRSGGDGSDTATPSSSTRPSSGAVGNCSDATRSGTGNGKGYNSCGGSIPQAPVRERSCQLDNDASMPSIEILGASRLSASSPLFKLPSGVAVSKLAISSTSTAAPVAASLVSVMAVGSAVLPTSASVSAPVSADESACCGTETDRTADGERFPGCISLASSSSRASSASGYFDADIAGTATTGTVTSSSPTTSLSCGSRVSSPGCLPSAVSLNNGNRDASASVAGWSALGLAKTQSKRDMLLGRLARSPFRSAFSTDGRAGLEGDGMPAREAEQDQGPRPEQQSGQGQQQQLGRTLARRCSYIWRRQRVSMASIPDVSTQPDVKPVPASEANQAAAAPKKAASKAAEEESSKAAAAAAGAAAKAKANADFLTCLEHFNESF